MFEFSLGILIVFTLYTFIAGAIAGLIIAENKESLRLASWAEKLLLALLIVFWPVSVLIGATIEE